MSFIGPVASMILHLAWSFSSPSSCPFSFLLLYCQPRSSFLRLTKLCDLLFPILWQCCFLLLVNTLLLVYLGCNVASSCSLCSTSKRVVFAMNNYNTFLVCSPFSSITIRYYKPLALAMTSLGIVYSSSFRACI